VTGADDFVIAAMVEAGVLDVARRFGAQNGLSVCESLTRQGHVTVRQLAIFRAETGEYPFVDLGHYELDYANTARLPRSAAEQLCAFPMFIGEELITVGMANPLDLRAVDQLRALLKVDIEVVLCEPEALRSLIDRAYALSGDGGREAGGTRVDVLSEDTTTGKEPIVAAVNEILAQAVEFGASRCGTW
jgi:hypothetical protein